MKNIRIVYVFIFLFCLPRLFAQTTVSNDFDDGEMAPFLECTTQDPHYTKVVDGRVKTFWSSEGGWNGARGDKGAEMCIATEDFSTTKEGWYGFTMTLGADYPVNKDAGVAQIFGFSNHYYTWEGMLKMTNNELIMGYRGKGSEQPGASDITNVTLMTDPPRETAMNIIIHFILSANKTGLIEIWIDGEKRMEETGINFGFGTWVDDIQTCDECRTELKAGQYNYDYENWDYIETRTVYYDNVTMYNGADGYQIVDPSNGEDLIDYIELKAASIVDDNPKQIIVEVTEDVAEYDTYEGFVVKVDQTEVSIENTTYNDVENVLYINLVNNITADHEVSISYVDGNILSQSGAAFINFEDALVNNLLEGAKPVINTIETSEDGTSVIVSFNKEMNLPSSLENLSLRANYYNDQNILFSDVDFFLEDPTSLSFTLAEKVYYDFQLYLSYSGNEISSKDNGMLTTFTDRPVENNSPGLPFRLIYATVDESGEFVSLKFDREIEDIQDQSDNFTFTINDQSVLTHHTIELDSTLLIYPESKMYEGDVVELSYSPGSLVRVVATNKEELDAFLNMSVYNNSSLNLDIVPGKIEAEDYADESGTVLEDCSEGGQDLAYIDSEDWAEYKVEVSMDGTYELTFRVASKNDDGKITIWEDNVNKGYVDVPNTGAWQTYESVSVDIELNSGERTIKLVFENSFNVNWMEFEEKVNVTVHDNLEQEQIYVYPNPALNQMVVECSDFKYDQIRILNTVGRVVYSNNGYVEKKILELSFPKGNYILELSNSEKKVTKHFVKL